MRGAGRKRRDRILRGREFALKNGTLIPRVHGDEGTAHRRIGLFRRRLCEEALDGKAGDVESAAQSARGLQGGFDDTGKSRRLFAFDPVERNGETVKPRRHWEIGIRRLRERGARHRRG